MPCSKRFDTRGEWKENYFTKLEEAIRNHSKWLLVNADNVSSLQFAKIRQQLRGQAVIVMGKNTMMKKVIRGLLEDYPDYERVLPLLVKNVGFIFTNGDLKAIRDVVLENKVAAPARAGALAPVDVIVPAQNTGMGPEKTSFFQALNIQTKISRGSIEIVSDVHLLKPGDIVGQSESTLLNMLKISPFSYGLKVNTCFDDGSVFDQEVLDITEEDIIKRFQASVNNVAACSLKIGYPTVISAPHSMANAFRKLMAVAAVTDISFPEVEALKDRLANPDAYVVEAAPVEQAAAVEEAKAESEEEEGSDSSMGFDLFG
jgi:large subunit ribosomal protein LP0